MVVVVVVVVCVVVGVEGVDAALLGLGLRGNFLSPWMGTRRRAVTLSGSERVLVEAREALLGLVARRGESAGVSASDELLSNGYCCCCC